MSILSNGWYKGSIPFYEITEISISTTGSGAESWDGSAEQNRSVLCYRNDTKITIVCDSMTEIGEKAFFKFIGLKKVSGLGSVTVVGAYAFYYTTNITSIDLNPENLTSIGTSAFRLSNVEDVLDLSNVSTSIIGDKGTRNKRWSASGLQAVKNLVFPKTIYFDVPNADNQNNYGDIPYGTYNGTAIYGNNGCASLCAYHIWNCLKAGSDKVYDNWLDWFNDTINFDGLYAEKNTFSGQLQNLICPQLGWTYEAMIPVDSSQQLQIIIDNLGNGLPTMVTMPSLSSEINHAVIIVGCDSKTHKLAIVDSYVAGTSGVTSWISFEDIFCEGTSDTDGIYQINYNIPVLAQGNTWFAQGGTSVKRSSITQIDVKNTYTPSGTVTSSWDASEYKDGSVMAYVEDSKLTLAGNGFGKIYLNPNSGYTFSDSGSDKFSNLTVINNAHLLDTRMVTDISRIFTNARKLTFVDVSNWNTSNVTTTRAMFGVCDSLESIDVSNWNTSNVTDMGGMFQVALKLKTLDFSKWDVGNVTDMTSMLMGHLSYGTMSLESVGDLGNWDVSKVKNMSNMFQMCPYLKQLDVSGWNTSSVTTMSNMFRGCLSLKELDVSGWDTSKVTTMMCMFDGTISGNEHMGIEMLDLSNWDTSACSNTGNMFNHMYSLQKIILGEKFSFTGSGSSKGSLPITNPSYINGADGNWYDVNGNSIAPSEVPDNMFGVYYATPAIAEEDSNQMVLIRKGNLMKTAIAIRTRSGIGKGYDPSEFAEAILQIV